MAILPDLRALRTQLVGAEMRFAFFNAERTAPGDGDGIQHRIDEAFEILLDPSRPRSPYYNRAAVRNGAALSVDALEGLPGDVAAIETTPAHVDAAVSARLLERGFVPAYQLCYLGTVPAGVRRSAATCSTLRRRTSIFSSTCCKRRASRFRRRNVPPSGAITARRSSAPLSFATSGTASAAGP
jgi:hypothetical protein